MKENEKFSISGHWFDIEICSSCNAKCSFCPHEKIKRERSFMEVRVLDKIAKEISEFAKKTKVTVGFCGMGEPLLKKKLFLKALERLIPYNVSVLLVTNAYFLTEDLLLNDYFSKLTSIQISFTGYDRFSYESIHKLDYQKVIKNIARMNKQLPGKIHINSLLLNSIKPFQDRFMRFWKKKGIMISFIPVHSRGGHLIDKEAYPGQFNSFSKCNIFKKITFISSDGEVLSCCHDVQAENVIGDCKELSLNKIIQKKQNMIAQGYKGFRICDNCTDFSFSGARRSF